MERDLERRMLHRASGYRSIVDVGPIISQREIPFRCGSDLVVLFEMMALSTLAETKLTKNYRLCRVSEESLAITMEFRAIGTHYGKLLALGGEPRERLADVDDWRRVASLRISE